MSAICVLLRAAPWRAAAFPSAPGAPAAKHHDVTATIPKHSQIASKICCPRRNAPSAAIPHAVRTPKPSRAARRTTTSARPAAPKASRVSPRLLGKPVIPLNSANGVERPRPLAVIDEQVCIGCTLCMQACPVDAIVGAPKQMHTVIAELCTGCDLCVPPCPVDCIAMLPVTGEKPAGTHGARARPTPRASATTGAKRVSRANAKRPKRALRRGEPASGTRRLKRRRRCTAAATVAVPASRRRRSEETRNHPGRARTCAQEERRTGSSRPGAAEHRARQRRRAGADRRRRSTPPPSWPRADDRHRRSSPRLHSRTRRQRTERPRPTTRLNTPAAA